MINISFVSTEARATKQILILWFIFFFILENNTKQYMVFNMVQTSSDMIQRILIGFVGTIKKCIAINFKIICFIRLYFIFIKRYFKFLFCLENYIGYGMRKLHCYMKYHKLIHSNLIILHGLILEPYGNPG